MLLWTDLRYVSHMVQVRIYLCLKQGCNIENEKAPWESNGHSLSVAEFLCASLITNTSRLWCRLLLDHYGKHWITGQLSSNWISYFIL